jgi:hypothetical protein
MLSACSGVTANEEIPQLEVLLPEADSQFFTGYDFPIQINFTDDVNLASYTLHISHTENFELSNPWDTLIQRNLVGQSSELTTLVHIPLAVQGGNYQLQSSCTDQFGNESLVTNRHFVLKNSADTIHPTLSVNSFPDTDTVTIFANTSPSIIGQASDNMGLNKLFICLYNADHEIIIYEHPIVNMAGEESFIVVETLPPLQAGYYHINIMLNDLSNNKLLKNYVIAVI